MPALSPEQRHAAERVGPGAIEGDAVLPRVERCDEREGRCEERDDQEVRIDDGEAVFDGHAEGDL